VVPQGEVGGSSSAGARVAQTLGSLPDAGTWLLGTLRGYRTGRAAAAGDPGRAFEHRQTGCMEGESEGIGNDHCEPYGLP
jgi:hypothetical protein